MKKRIKWIDFARGLSILSVVCGHSFGSVYDTRSMDPVIFNSSMSFLFTFMMPCFFAISGYLYKHIYSVHSYLLILYKKLVSLGIPYIMFSIIYVWLQNIGNEGINNFHSYYSLLFIYKTPISYLWFLYALFFMFCIVGLFDLLKVNCYLQLFIYFLLMSVSIIFPHLLSTGVTWTFNNIIYFYIGYLLSVTSLVDKMRSFVKSSKILNYILFITFFVLLLLQSNYITGGPTDISTFSDFPTKLVSILLLIQISKELSINRINGKFFKYFNKYGKLTLVIYLIHGPFVSVARIILFKCFSLTSLDVIFIAICIFLLAWYFSILFCYLVRNFSFIYFVFYPRKKYISRLVIKTKWGKWLLNSRGK